MLELADVRRELNLPEAVSPQLALMADIPPLPVSLPDDRTADDALRRLGFADADRSEALAARPDFAASPELRWLAERCRRQIVDGLGAPAREMLPWPTLGTQTGAVGRFFYVWVLLATLPDIRSWHTNHGIDDASSWEILADLGRQVGVHRRIFGTGGLHTQHWMTLHWRGAIYSFGRLQFERHHRKSAEPVVLADGRTIDAGEHALSVHIPDAGPFRPADCDASFAAAKEFFPRHFPIENYRSALCVSWLMDPQLAEYLPATSNIIQFQRRFQLTDEIRDGDRSIMEFVFRRVDTDTAGLPRESTLQRAVLSHLEAGHHWHLRTAWLTL